MKLLQSYKILKMKNSVDILRRAYIRDMLYYAKINVGMLWNNLLFKAYRRKENTALRAAIKFQWTTSVERSHPCDFSFKNNRAIRYYFLEYRRSVSSYNEAARLHYDKFFTKLSKKLNS